MDLLLALGVVGLCVAAGLPLAFALTRTWGLAVVVAPLVTALLATVATVLMLLVGGPLVPWLVAVFVAQVLVTPLLLRRRVEPVPYGSLVDAAWLVVPLLPPFLAAFAPPTFWDAHAIWWLHAAYFAEGADTSRYAIASPVFAFSHPGYPPLPSAAVATAWSAMPGYDFQVAQFASATVTLSAVALLSYAVRTVTGQAPPLVARLAGTGVALGAWGGAHWAVAGGLSDALWSAAFAAAAVLLLLGQSPVARPALVAMLLTVAALSKQEGFVMTVALAAVVTLRERRRLRSVWWVWPPVAAGAVWVLLAWAAGAGSNVVAGARFEALLAGEPAVLRRLWPTVVALASEAGPYLAGSLLVSLLGVLFLRYARRRAGIGSGAWLWVLVGAYAAMLTVTYLVSPYDVAWHLGTSADRVSTLLILLALANAACWAVVAAVRLNDEGGTSDPLSGTQTST